MEQSCWSMLGLMEQALASSQLWIPLTAWCTHKMGFPHVALVINTRLLTAWLKPPLPSLHVHSLSRLCLMM